MSDPKQQPSSTQPSQDIGLPPPVYDAQPQSSHYPPQNSLPMMPQPRSQSTLQSSQQGGFSPQYAPQNGPALMQPPPVQMQPAPKTPAQIGEEYRAALFAQCAQGIHEPKTSYGPCGIITAVLCFPCGLICLFTDTEQKCSRCGVKL
uniref:Uncharacterized protein n=1 Tax=Moniliophthora roreri TaxID=221103 RepID=A0A0W0FAG3_MONRR